MREPRGPVAKIADTITGTMRRRQRDRAPRVLLYGADGRPRMLPAGEDAHAEIVVIAEKLVVLATGRAQPEEPPAEVAEPGEPAG